MRKLTLLASASALALSLGACQQFNTQVADPLITTLSKIANTTQADLGNAISVAKVATPPDTDGVNCYTALQTVNGNVMTVLNTANNSNAGVVTTAEIASLFQPGSIQYTTEEQVLVSGCAAKAQDVLGAAGVVAAGGVVGALASGQVAAFLAAP